jgi:hypothetical protein
MIISIDRTAPFDPVKSLGQGSTIEEQDERSLLLTKVDLDKIRLVSCLFPGETKIDGFERGERLIAGVYTRLDVGISDAIWKNKHHIPEHWQKETEGCPTYICFDGTIMRQYNSGNEAIVKYICYKSGAVSLYSPEKSWQYFYDRLASVHGVNYLSAVIEGA